MRRQEVQSGILPCRFLCLRGGWDKPRPRGLRMRRRRDRLARDRRGCAGIV